MRRDPISTSYARALIELAAERDELDTVLEEARFLRRLLAEDRDFRTFIVTPGIDASSKKKTLEKVLRGKLTDTVVDFLQVVVVRKGRAFLLESILEQYCDLYDERMNRVRVEAVTAVGLSEDRHEKLGATLGKKLRKTVLLENIVRPEILGGLVIRYGDLVVDGSIRSRLRELSTLAAKKKPGSEFIHEDQA